MKIEVEFSRLNEKESREDSMIMVHLIVGDKNENEDRKKDELYKVEDLLETFACGSTQQI